MPDANHEGPRSSRIPESHLQLYSELLYTVYDIPPPVFSGEDESMILCALMCQHYSGLLALEAIHSAHHKTAMAPGRQKLVAALRVMDPVKILWAFEECQEAADGLPEVAEQWARIRSMYEPRGNA